MPAAPRQRSTFRPQLEALEDRWMPSILTVTNNLDSGAGSLRYEIAAAKSNDTINFAPSLDGQTITLTSDWLAIDGIRNLTIQGPGAGQLTVSGGGKFTVFSVGAKAYHITLSGLTISNGNLEGPYGAGGINNSGTLTVTGCTVSGNTGLYGGGIYNEGKLTVSFCTVAANTAGQNGGGIYNALGATLTVTGCTVDNNGASGDINFGPVGGGIYNEGPASDLTISNTVFYLNYPFSIGGPYTDGGGNIFK